MFRIIKAGAGIGLTENLNYIKKPKMVATSFARSMTLRALFLRVWLTICWAVPLWMNWKR